MDSTTRKSRSIWLFVCVLLAIGVFGLLTFVMAHNSIDAYARADETFNATCGIPVVDGNVSSIEWSNAATMSIQMINPSAAPPFTTTLYLMNSANYLYMGITINDDEFSTYGNYLPEGDVFIIVFDNDHSGTLFDLENNVTALAAGIPQFEDRYIYNATGSNQSDILGGGTSDGQGATSRVNDLNHFEMKFPLCSGDNLDFCLDPTDIVGFRLEYLDAEGDGSFGGSQLFPGTTDTSQADIVIGECTSVSDIFAYLPFIKK